MVLYGFATYIKAGQCEVIWSFSKLQMREEGMNPDNFRVICCNAGTK
jgi:hypothetical protein